MNFSKINWSKLFLFKKAAILFSLMGLCLVLSSVIGIFVPKVIASLSKNYGHETKYFNDLIWLTVIFSLIYINRVTYQIIVNIYVKKLILHVRSYSFSTWILSFDLLQADKLSNKDRYPQGEVLARIMTDTEAIRELIRSGSFGIFIDLFFVVSCFISFISINRNTGVIIGAVELVAALLLVWGSKYMRVIFMSVRHSKGMMYRATADIVGGLRDFFYVSTNRYSSKKGERYFNDFLYKQLKSNFWDASYYSVAESLYPLLLIIVIVVFPYSKITEAAIIFAIVDLIQRSISPIKDISGKIANIQRAITGLERISEFIKSFEVFSSEEQGRPGEIDLKKLEVNIPKFKYDSKNRDQLDEFSLKNISFTANKGELVGIVGHSGCGKSTLLNILAGDILPQKFSLKIFRDSGGFIDFNELDLLKISLYKGNVGIVSQDSHIFSESLYFNISLNKRKRSDFDIFWGWIKEQIPYLESWNLLPDDKILKGELSVGQTQLLAAIRACYLNKAIVLFDEVSSGLDSSLENALRKVIRIIQKNSLTFIVAHRIETVVSADQIIVMDNGEIADIGVHSELLLNSKKYADFVREIRS